MKPAPGSGRLSAVGALLRRVDRDRYLTALFAAAEARERLFALYAFNAEIAKVRETVTEPLLGRIRLQWWREAIGEIYDGKPPRRHEVVEPLAAAIGAAGLSRGLFERMIDGRERDLEEAPPETLTTLVDYAGATGGALAVLAGESLGATDDETRQALTRVGTGYALIGLARAAPFHARQRRQYIPAEIASFVGLSPGALFDGKGGDALARAVELVATEGSRHVWMARLAWRGVDRARALPALLPNVLALAYFRRLEKAGWTPESPRAGLSTLGKIARLWWANRRGRY
jgi:NADH dehydrogenase [ubiquinone] 1 alpha subcomplex assembly factor 6